MPPHVHTQTFRVAMSEVDVAQIHFHKEDGVWNIKFMAWREANAALRLHRARGGHAVKRVEQ